MLSVNTFLGRTSYKEIVASIVDVMATNFEDFAADLLRFKETISLLEGQLEEDASPSVADEMQAIEQRIGSVVLFSYFLGFKANLDHFMDPIGRTFLNVDTETYLRENLSKQLPDYQNALRVQERFYAALTPVQQERYEDITAYICHLETVGPKLAHYCGYILGNWLFLRIVPGYGKDMPFTFQYRNMLENYFGISIK